jgi:hypothetical protein
MDIHQDMDRKSDISFQLFSNMCFSSSQNTKLIDPENHIHKIHLANTDLNRGQHYKIKKSSIGSASAFAKGKENPTPVYFHKS